MANTDADAAVMLPTVSSGEVDRNGCRSAITHHSPATAACARPDAGIRVANASSTALTKRILIEWDGSEDPNPVERTFEAKGEQWTLVKIRNWGFSGNADEVAAKALDSTGGFHLVLAGKVFPRTWHRARPGR